MEVLNNNQVLTIIEQIAEEPILSEFIQICLQHLDMRSISESDHSGLFCPDEL